MTKQPPSPHYRGVIFNTPLLLHHVSADSKLDYLSDADIDSLINLAFPKNTKKVTAWKISVLKDKMSSSQEYSDSTIEIDGDYIFSVRGFLKIFEFILLLAAFIFALLYRDFYSPPHLPFFLVVLFFGFLFILMLYLFFFCSLEKKFDSFDWRLLDVVFSGCLAVFLIVSGGLMAHEARFSEKHGKDFTSWYYDRLVAAVVLPFVAVIILIIDIIYSLFRYFRYRKHGH